MKDFLNLFIFSVIKPLWLRKLCVNLLGYTIIYMIIVYNRESALLISLFFSVFAYRKTQQQFQLNIKEEKRVDSPQKLNQYDNTILNHFIISLFCACLLSFNTWQVFVIQIIISLIFIFIYDIYKPSLIGRFYNLTSNPPLGYIMSAILHGILSGISTMLVYSLFLKMFNISESTILTTKQILSFIS